MLIVKKDKIGIFANILRVLALKLESGSCVRFGLRWALKGGDTCNKAWAGWGLEHVSDKGAGPRFRTWGGGVPGREIATRQSLSSGSRLFLLLGAGVSGSPGCGSGLKGKGALQGIFSGWNERGVFTPSISTVGLEVL